MLVVENIFCENMKMVNLMRFNICQFSVWIFLSKTPLVPSIINLCWQTIRHWSNDFCFFWICIAITLVVSIETSTSFLAVHNSILNDRLFIMLRCHVEPAYWSSKHCERYLIILLYIVTSEMSRKGDENSFKLWYVIALNQSQLCISELSRNAENH